MGLEMVLFQLLRLLAILVIFGVPIALGARWLMNRYESVATTRATELPTREEFTALVDQVESFGRRLADLDERQRFLERLLEKSPGARSRTIPPRGASDRSLASATPVRRGGRVGVPTGPRRGAPDMTADEFRTTALAFPEVIERAHQGHPDFWVGGRIFATVGYPDGEHAVVRLSPEEQTELVEAHPAVFAPVAGAWGASGSTAVTLSEALAALLHAGRFQRRPPVLSVG
ncbi:MAG: MmcQ/YjbR family DNA-binding protein [Candidatus Palauibacterales bacterium]|nr:MmcQ/YjbR family DNA-binding protein [Candidatus Palauibacterales bacterium]MDP2584949.1 MmcQ/YjbR family DNA-binding protein [Candidatus Palauibacterales bacterium]